MAFPETCWAVLRGDDRAVAHRAVAHIVLTFRVWSEDGTWEGICAELGVPSFGEGPGDALSSVIDATICYLNEVERLGERERIFAERGLQLRAGEPADTIEEAVATNQSVARIDLGIVEAVA